MTVVEAFAVGLPVIASRIGSLASLIGHGRTGFLFEPGNSQELSAHGSERIEVRVAARISRVRCAKTIPDRLYAKSELFDFDGDLFICV